jgi:hypothetical protein
VDFRSTSLTAVTCSGSSATVTGVGYDGDDETTFTAEVSDGGASDSLSVTLGSGYTRGGPLTKGNLKVHN